MNGRKIDRRYRQRGDMYIWLLSLGQRTKSEPETSISYCRQALTIKPWLAQGGGEKNCTNSHKKRIFCGSWCNFFTAPFWHKAVKANIISSTARWLFKSKVRSSVLFFVGEEKEGVWQIVIPPPPPPPRCPEVENRCGVVIVWQCDKVLTACRRLEVFCFLPDSDFSGQGAKSTVFFFSKSWTCATDITWKRFWGVWQISEWSWSGWDSQIRKNQCFVLHCI